MRFQYARQTYVFGTGWVPSSWLDAVPDIFTLEEEELSRNNDQCEEESAAAQRRTPWWSQGNDENSE